MLVRFGEVDIDIHGAADDAYFRAAQESVHGFEPLLSTVRRAPANATILDIGANIGLSTIAMALALPSARVIAFEPSPANFDYMNENIKCLEGRDIAVRQAAISDRPGALHFHAAQTGGWSHVVGENHLGGNVENIRVDAIPLDDLTDLRPDFMKVDVEGHEPEVLAGAKRLIEDVRPLIFMEFNIWPLNAYAGHSPAAFASAIFEAFDVDHWSDAGSFLNHVIGVGGITDIVMRLKDGASVPTLEEMSYPPKARAALADLRARVALRQ